MENEEILTSALHRDFNLAKDCLRRTVTKEELDFIDRMSEQIYRLVEFLSKVAQSGENSILAEQSISDFRNALAEMNDSETSRMFVRNKLSLVDFPRQIVRTIGPYDISQDIEDLE